MSRIYDALKKLEAERHGANGATNGHGSGNGTNGHGNGNGHHGNGNGDGKRRGWGQGLQWLFAGNSGRLKRNDGLPVNFDLGPEVEEAYQRLGTNLLVAPGSEAVQQPKLLGIVAARHGEGTTTTAAVLASILCRRRGGRVVVVEANYRSPSFETAFGIKANGGLAQLVDGTQSLAEVAQATQLSNLFAIGCGSTEVPPSALFDAPGFAPALNQLREHFDFVIFDLPPVNVYGDSLIIGPRLDAAVIVIEADATRISEVERARRTLERTGVHCVGSVLNRRRNYIPAFIDEML
jgi:capsular exopolysaccharide synthesis family protein